MRYRALTTCAIMNVEGGPVVIKTGSAFDDRDPLHAALIRAHPTFFERLVSDDVEAATAAPGEKRNVRRTSTT